MSLYDEMIDGGIDVHCHIDFEFSAKERKREPEFLWLPKAEAMGMRGVVLKSQPMHHRILRRAWRQNGFSSDLERAQRRRTQRL
jgi:hypothetical protein